MIIHYIYICPPIPLQPSGGSWMHQDAPGCVGWRLRNRLTHAEDNLSSHCSLLKVVIIVIIVIIIVIIVIIILSLRKSFQENSNLVESSCCTWNLFLMFNGSRYLGDGREVVAFGSFCKIKYCGRCGRSLSQLKRQRFWRYYPGRITLYPFVRLGGC